MSIKTRDFPCWRKNVDERESLALPISARAAKQKKMVFVVGKIPDYAMIMRSAKLLYTKKT